MSKGLTVKINSDTYTVNFSVRTLHDVAANGKLLLVSFHDVVPAISAKPCRSKVVIASDEQLRIVDLERDLAYSKESVQATIEEPQASNEELQSTNEELETSKEELQSVNEELITVNVELQSKIEQLAGMQNDMKNLLDNINISTIFLDDRLYIKRYTHEAAQVYRLVASDIGRALNDIKSNIKNDDLLADTQAVLDTLTSREREVHTVGGACYLARIQPYQTLDNVIEGVVLTFTDISKRVEAELAEKAARILAEGIVDTVREPLMVLDGKLKIISASRSFYREFKTTPEDTVDRKIYDVGDRQWDIPKLRELLETILPSNQSFDGYELEYNFPATGHHRMLLNARRIVDSTGMTQMILLAIEIVL
jgi:two-component system CheB/CheR fusion protein